MTWELTQDIEDRICEELASGRSLISICAAEDMPSRWTVLRWMRQNDQFATSIARARDDQADYYLDKQIEFTEIATINDYQLRKFQADNLKWVASKLKPKKYGDSTQVKMADADGNKIEEVRVRVVGND